MSCVEIADLIRPETVSQTATSRASVGDRDPKKPIPITPDKMARNPKKSECIDMLPPSESTGNTTGLARR